MCESEVSGWPTDPVFPFPLARSLAVTGRTQEGRGRRAGRRGRDTARRHVGGDENRLAAVRGEPHGGRGGGGLLLAGPPAPAPARPPARQRHGRGGRGGGRDGQQRLRGGEDIPQPGHPRVLRHSLLLARHPAR